MYCLGTKRLVVINFTEQTESRVLMYITKDLIKSFSKDVKATAKDCKSFHGDLYVDVRPSTTGVTVVISSSNGYSKSDAHTMAQNFVKRWENIFVFERHSNFLKEDVCRRFASYSGEGEYEEDYGMEVQFYFDFAENVCRSNEGYAVQYYKIKKELFTFLKELVNDDTYLIEDKGSFCDIGDYFRYDYEKGEISVIGRVHLFAVEMEQLQGLINRLLVCLSNIGAPVHSVIIDRFIPYFQKYLYFCSTGEECTLWNDVRINTSCSIYT